MKKPTKPNTANITFEKSENLSYEKVSHPLYLVPSDNHFTRFSEPT